MDQGKQLSLFDAVGENASPRIESSQSPIYEPSTPIPGKAQQPEAAGPQAKWQDVDPRHDLVDLAEVAENVLVCTRCKLCESRKLAVPGEGNPCARLMWIGEGPGADEDRFGRPFVGRAGQLLDRIIASMGMARQDTFITNVVKCRPPANRVPEPDEVTACVPYLARQIELIQPQIIVILGATALKALIDPGASITRMRGNWLERGGIRIMPTFHPAALLRDPSKNRPVWADMKQVMSALR